jgi:hypothetical protein
MAQQDIIFLYIKSDNLIKVENLVKKSFGDDEIINDATVTMTLYDGVQIMLESAAAAVDYGGGLVAIPVHGHSLQAGDTVRIWGTKSYDGVYQIDSVAEGVIHIPATYAVETFTGAEYLHRAVPGAVDIEFTAVGSNGNYSGVLSDTVDMTPDATYYLEISAQKNDSDLLIRHTCKAVFFPKRELY